MEFGDYARALARRWRSRRFDGPRHDGPRPALIAIEQTESTHLLARRIVDDYRREEMIPPAADLLAWQQTGGVGRNGRKWSSPPGKGIYATLIRPLATGDAAIQLLPVAVAVDLCEVLNRHLGGTSARCRLKWPNDLMVRARRSGAAAPVRKLGGILIDVFSGEPAIAVLSFGVNFSRDLAAFGEPRATSIEAEASAPGCRMTMGALARELVEAVEGSHARASRPAGLVERFRSLSLHRPGDELSCRLDSEVMTGTFLGFDRLGFLRLDVDGEERLLSAGVVDG